MATNYFKAIHHHHHNQNHHMLRRRHSIDCPSSTNISSTSTSSFSFLKARKTPPLTTFSLSSTTTSSPSTPRTISLDLLHQHLSSQNFRQADEETRRLLIVLAGDAAQKRGYVFFSEVQFISADDLKAIDQLWRKYSNDRFGYSVQKKIWNKVGKDFSRFFVKVGWMKKLDTEVVQYNYRAFPEEFVWEMDEKTPELGHLPLTNALRGTQLLTNILNHPAFQGEGEEEEIVEGEEEIGRGIKGSGNGGMKTEKPLMDKVFKPDYSF